MEHILNNKTMDKLILEIDTHRNVLEDNQIVKDVRKRALEIREMGLIHLYVQTHLTFGQVDNRILIFTKTKRK